MSRGGCPPGHSEPERVRARLEVLLEQTGADELIFTGDLYQPEQRLRSFVAGLRWCRWLSSTDNKKDRFNFRANCQQSAQAGVSRAPENTAHPALPGRVQFIPV